MRLIRAQDLGRQKTIDPYLAEGLVRNALMQGRHRLEGLDDLQRTTARASDNEIIEAVRRGDWLLVPNDIAPASGSLLSPAQPVEEPTYIFEDAWPAQKPGTNKVFAKSCTPNNWGRTKPGTTIEPVSHFGKVMIAGAVALPASATAAANAGADTALARLAGGGIMQRGYTWALRGAATAAAEGAGAASVLNPISLFILGMLPTTMGDGTLHQNDQLRDMDHAPTRVRFQFRRDASGALHAYGIHTGPDGDDAVRTVKAEWNADRNALEAHLNGLTILWIPNKGPQAIPPLIYPDHPGEQLDTIRVHPIPDNIDTEIEGYPAGEDITTDDFILTFPANSGLRSLYIVYATSPRLENGVVTGQGQDVTGIWLAGAGKELGSPIPSQIADKLRGREFSRFDDFREAFWTEVAADPELSSQFSAANRKVMRGGSSPFVQDTEAVGGRKVHELHHVDRIIDGGAVYDVDNLRVTTPKNHINIHNSK